MTIRYNDMDVKFGEGEAQWSMEREVLAPSKGLSFSDAWAETTRFNRIKHDLSECLSNTIESTVQPCNSEEEVGVALDPVFERLSKSFFLSNGSINPNLLLSKANKNTIQKKLQSWADQLNHNVPVIKASPGIKIFHDRFKNVPCIVVTAGPSLQNAIELLKQMKGRAVIMAVGPSFRPLTKRGIIPDFVNAHDANGPNPQLGTGGGPRFFKDAYAKETVALFVNYIYPGTIEAYDGPRAFYYVEDDSIAVYKTMALACDGAERQDGSFLPSKIIGGSSVAHTAMYAAIDMGCNPITFVGLDLSYPDLNRSHFESDNAKDIHQNELIDVMAVNGKIVKTNLSFYSYKTVFDRMAPLISQAKNVQLFNSSQNDDGSPAGIVHAGLKPMPFKEWCEKFASTERSELKTILDLHRTFGKY